MPSAPKRPCPVPRCPELTTGGKCDLHRQQSAKATDARRGTSQERGYNYRWSLVSKAHLKQYPLCGMKDVCAYEGWRGECYEQKRLTKATCTDHIIPHKGDQYLFWDFRNRQSLCHACHSLKTTRYEGGFGHAPVNQELSDGA